MPGPFVHAGMDGPAVTGTLTRPFPRNPKPLWPHTPPTTASTDIGSVATSDAGDETARCSSAQSTQARPSARMLAAQQAADESDVWLWKRQAEIVELQEASRTLLKRVASSSITGTVVSSRSSTPKRLASSIMSPPRSTGATFEGAFGKPAVRPPLREDAGSSPQPAAEPVEAKRPDSGQLSTISIASQYDELRGLKDRVDSLEHKNCELADENERLRKATYMIEQLGQTDEPAQAVLRKYIDADVAAMHQARRQSEAACRSELLGWEEHAEMSRARFEEAQSSSASLEASLYAARSELQEAKEHAARSRAQPPPALFPQSKVVAAQSLSYDAGRICQERAELQRLRFSEEALQESAAHRYELQTKLQELTQRHRACEQRVARMEQEAETHKEELEKQQQAAVEERKKLKRETAKKLSEAQAQTTELREESVEAAAKAKDTERSLHAKLSTSRQDRQKAEAKLQKQIQKLWEEVREQSGLSQEQQDVQVRCNETLDELAELRRSVLDAEAECSEDRARHLAEMRLMGLEQETLRNEMRSTADKAKEEFEASLAEERATQQEEASSLRHEISVLETRVQDGAELERQLLVEKCQLSDCSQRLADLQHADKASEKRAQEELEERIRLQLKAASGSELELRDQLLTLREERMKERTAAGMLTDRLRAEISDLEIQEAMVARQQRTELATVRRQSEEGMRLNLATSGSELELREQLLTLREERMKERSTTDKLADRLRAEVSELEQQEAAVVKEQRTEMAMVRKQAGHAEEQASQLRSERRRLESRVQDGSEYELQLRSEMRQLSEAKEENVRLRNERRRASQRLAVAEQAENDRVSRAREEVEERTEQQLQAVSVSEQQLREQLRSVREERMKERTKADKQAERLRAKMNELENQEERMKHQLHASSSSEEKLREQLRNLREERTKEKAKADKTVDRLRLKVTELEQQEVEHHQEALEDAVGLRASLGDAEQQALNSEGALMKLATEAENAMRGEEAWREECCRLDSEIHAEEVALAAAAGRAVSQAEETFQKREHKLRGEAREAAAVMEKQVHQISEAAKKLAPLLGGEASAQLLQQLEAAEGAPGSELIMPLVHVMQAATRRLGSLEQRLHECKDKAASRSEKEAPPGRQESKEVVTKELPAPRAESKDTKDSMGEKGTSDRAVSAAIAASARRERELNSQNFAMQKTLAALRAENEELKQEQQKRANQGHKIAALQGRIIKLLEENGELKQQQQQQQAKTDDDGEPEVPKPILASDKGPPPCDYKKRLSQLQGAKAKVDEELWLLKRQMAANLVPLKAEAEKLRAELAEQQQKAATEVEAASRRATNMERRARTLEARLREHEDGRAALVAEKEAVEAQLETAAKQLEALLAEEHRDSDLHGELSRLSKQFETLHAQHREQLRCAAEQSRELALEREGRQKLEEQLMEATGQMQEAVDVGAKREEELASVKEALRQARKQEDTQAQELQDALSEKTALIQESEHLRAAQRQQQSTVQQLKEEMRRIRGELAQAAEAQAQAQKEAQAAALAAKEAAAAAQPAPPSSAGAAVASAAPRAAAATASPPRPPDACSGSGSSANGSDDAADIANAAVSAAAVAACEKNGHAAAALEAPDCSPGGNKLCHPAADGTAATGLDAKGGNGGLGASAAVAAAAALRVGDVDEEIERAFSEIAGPGSGSCTLDNASSASREASEDAQIPALTIGEPPSAGGTVEAGGTSLAALASAATALAAAAGREAPSRPRPPLPPRSLTQPSTVATAATIVAADSEAAARQQHEQPEPLVEAVDPPSPPRRWPPIAEDVQLRLPDSSKVWVRGVDQPVSVDGAAALVAAIGGAVGGPIRGEEAPRSRNTTEHVGGYPVSPPGRDDSWLEALQESPDFASDARRESPDHTDPTPPAPREPHPQSEAQVLSARASEAFCKAEALCELQRFAEAVPILEHCLELLTDCDRSVVPNAAVAEVWAHLGIAHQSLDRVHKAIECYSQAVDLDSSLHVCYANLASLHSYLRQREEAGHWIGKALALDPDNPTYVQILQQLEVAPAPANPAVTPAAAEAEAAPEAAAALAEVAPAGAGMDSSKAAAAPGVLAASESVGGPGTCAEEQHD